MNSKFFVLTLSSMLFAISASAQSLEGFSSGRYEIRKTNEKKSKQHNRSLASDEKKASESSVFEETSAEAKSEAKVEVKTESKKSSAVSAAPAEASPVVVDVNGPASSTPSVTKVEVQEQAIVVSETREEPSLQEQAQSLFSAKAEKIREFYQEQVHPDDIRNNRVEIEFAPAAVYNDSQSNFSFRDYQSYFNALKVGANVWFTPLIGVEGQILFSFAGDLASNDGSDARVPAKYEMIDLGVNFRKFFGLSRKSNSLEMSLLYSEHKMSPPGDNESRSRLKSQGVGIGLKARLPTSANYAWTVGGSFFPRLTHTESEPGKDLSSGDPSESTRLGLEVGGEIKFTREAQVIWGLSASAERNLFDGQAALVDPSTGSTPSNVSVTNSFYMFSLGYRWGH